MKGKGSGRVSLVTSSPTKQQEELRECRGCGETKTLGDFYTQWRAGVLHVQPVCKVCFKKRQNERRAAERAGVARDSSTTPYRTSIDLGLEVIEAVRGPGETLTLRDIAAVCECSFQRVYQLEQQAFRKLRKELKRRGLTTNEFNVEVLTELIGP